MQSAVQLAEPNNLILADVAYPDPVVIVGAGPVGMHSLRLLLKMQPNVPVRVYGDERYEPYDRVQLSGLLAGQHTFAELELAGDLMRQELPNTQFVGKRVVSIDPVAKAVTDSSGQIQGYRSLILATGSRPFVPAIAGSDLAGVYTFRDMADAEKLAARRVLSQHTVVLGAGLLGIEAARAMQRHNTKVTLVDHNTHPMYRQLDAAAGSLLADELTARGINLSVGNSVRMLLGTRSVEGVVLRDGTQIPCDTVILATGIVPNRDLAEQAGLAFGRGIKVNEFMQTSVEDVYAVGECCEFEGHVYGIVAPGLEQASIAVRRIGGEESSPYRKPQLATSLKVAGMSVFSLGDPQTRASLRTYTYREGATYRRVTLFGAYIESINAIGDWPELPVLRDLAQRRAWISPVKLWRFRRTGNLFSEGTSVNVGQWADTAIVCNCNSVSCGDLRAAVACGANSVQALTLATKAGGGCGSCQPLLREMLGSDASQESIPKKPWLSGASIVAGFVSLIALCLAIGYPDTVQLSWRWDELWRSSLFKQISGFSILGLTAVSLLVSLRKRIPKLKLGDFAGWRIAHISLTVLALLALGVHTGFRFGSNLNFALMMTFLGIALAGVLLGASIALEHRLAPALSMRLRSMGIWGHVLFLWPLPALLAVHVFKTYYF